MSNQTPAVKIRFESRDLLVMLKCFFLGIFFNIVIDQVQHMVLIKPIPIGFALQLKHIIFQLIS